MTTYTTPEQIKQQQIDILNTLTREQVISMFEQFIAARPHLDPMDYGSEWRAYRNDANAISRQRRTAEQWVGILYSPNEYRVDLLADALTYAFSGRLNFEIEDNAPVLRYTAGQYYPLEYRRAAAVVLERYANLLNR